MYACVYIALCHCQCRQCDVFKFKRKTKNTHNRAIQDTMNTKTKTKQTK